MAPTRYIPADEQQEIIERNKKRKPADVGWIEHTAKKLEPIVEGFGAGGSASTRALGPVKEVADPAMNWAASQLTRPFPLGDPTRSPEQVKERRAQLEKDNPRAAEAGYRTASIARDAALARLGLGPLVMADRMRTMAFGSGTGAVSQGFDEWDRHYNQDKPFQPDEVIERLLGATTGGAVGALVGQQAAKYNPLSKSVNRVPGRPLDTEQLTALSKAEQLAKQHGDDAPDLAQLMRLAGEPRMGTRAADVESMYRKARPVVVQEADILKHTDPASGQNRLTGRLTEPLGPKGAQVAPQVLDQLNKRSAPGGFTQRVDDLAADLAHRQRELDRTLGQRQVGVSTPVTDVIPPPGTVPPSIGRARGRLYDQEVEAARAPQPLPPGAAGPQQPFLTEAQAKARVGSPDQMRFWDATLARLPARERALLEDVLGSIQPRAGVGAGPPGIGTAITKRTAAQRGLDEHGQVQKSIGESYPYRPGELPQLTIAPPAFTGGLSFGVKGTNPSGWATRATDKAFTNPVAAGRDIGRMSPQELWAAWAMGQLGAHGMAAVVEGQSGHVR